MNFSEIIKKVSSDKRLIPDLLKSENGNNFRAVSESAILDVIDPILKETGWFYVVEVNKSELQIREAFGSKGKKLQFIATVEITLKFYNEGIGYDVSTQAVGMGIDDNDKAMGKAYTYAVKYALLKLFRLRYGDDPDFETSKPLHTEKPKEDISSKTLNKKDEKTKETGKNKDISSKPVEQKETPMTEKQRDYILGLMKSKSVTEKQIISKFGYEPSRDEFIPMKVARAIIKFLEEQDDLPF